MIEGFFSKDSFIASLQEDVNRARKLLNIPHLSKDLEVHIQRFIYLTLKECHERRSLE